MDDQKIKQQQRKAINELASWCFHQRFTYFVTFRSRPLVKRQWLESMISMFCQRLDRRVIGRNYYKPENHQYRTDALVVYQDEDIGDLHAHALFRLPINTKDQQKNIWKDKTASAAVPIWIVDQMHRCWNGKQLNQKDYFSMRDHQNCVNPKGTIDIRYLVSEEDAINTFAYSLRKSDLEKEDWKFLSEHQRNKHPNMNPFDAAMRKSRLKLTWSCRSSNTFRKELAIRKIQLHENSPRKYMDRYIKRSGPVIDIPVEQYNNDKYQQ